MAMSRLLVPLSEDGHHAVTRKLFTQTLASTLAVKIVHFISPVRSLE
jgi:hypothetical protein